MPAPSSPDRVLLLGATGTTGRAVLRELVSRGHDVVCFARPRTGARIDPADALLAGLPESSWPRVQIRFGEVTDPRSVRSDAFAGESFDAVVSCMASRSGAPADAWRIDHDAHQAVFEAALERGVRRWIQLSAICLQKPRLEFQRAKLSFERTLMASKLDWVIVRPTAFFKSLSGQLERVRAGRPFLVFGDGTLTPCKPIGHDDLAAFVVDCLHDGHRYKQIRPIGGPGPALTPLDHGRLLSAAVGQPLRVRHVPVGLLDAVVAVLATVGRLLPNVAEKAELARIGRYYATESMLVWNEAQQRYDADATPEYGHDTLGAYYERLARGLEHDERGEHALF